MILVAAYGLLLVILWLVVPLSALSALPIASILITGTDVGFWSFATLAAALVLAAVYSPDVEPMQRRC